MTENDCFLIEDDEISKVLDDIYAYLETLTARQRKLWFAKISRPHDWDFGMDFGNTVIIVRNHLDENTGGTVTDKLKHYIAEKV